MNRRQWLKIGAASLAGAAATARASVTDAFSTVTMPVDTMNRVPGWMPEAFKPLELKGRRIGEGRPKLIAPTTAKTSEDFVKTVKTLAARPELDMIEARLDYLGNLKPDEFARLTREAYEASGDKILLVTVRNGTDGGPINFDDATYEAVYSAVIASGRADVLDFEIFRDAAMTARLIEAAHAKGIKVILSDHEFKFMPEEDEIIRRLILEDRMGADILKIAVMAHSPEDALKLMSATAKVRRLYSNKPMLTMAMGKWGVLTRITGEGFGSDLTFASVGGKASAPGQIPSAECLQVLETLHKAMNP